MDYNSILSTYRDQINRFVQFSDEEWGLLEEYLRINSYPKNANVVQAGKTCKSLSFIISGAVRYCNQVNDKEVTGYFCFENSFVTALKSFHTGEPSLYSIKTLTDTVMVDISRANLDSLLVHPILSCKMEKFGRLVAESFNLLFEDRIKSFIVKTPEERYRDLLETGREIVQRIPVQFIAQYIGITPVSLSRIRKRVLNS